MPRYKKHDHDYADIVDGTTKWSACRVCGADNPANPKPKEPKK